MKRTFAPRRNVLKPAVEVLVYYALLYFLERYFLAGRISDGIHRESYSVPGVLAVVLLTALLVSLRLLAPFFAGRMNRDYWAAWGCISFVLQIVVYAGVSLLAGFFDKPALFYTGLGFASYGFFDLLPLAYIAVLYCVAAWLGSRNARAGSLRKSVKRTRKLALG